MIFAAGATLARIAAVHVPWPESSACPSAGAMSTAAMAALAWLGAGAEFRSGVVDARVEEDDRSAPAVVPRGGRVADLLETVAPLSSATLPAGDPASGDGGHGG